MGSSQSTPNNNKTTTSSSKVMDTPIQVSPNNKNEQSSSSSSSSPFPTPTGHEYDAIDRIASELPNVIDDESKQQVEDYKQACDNGKGPMVACFATAEYLSLFERKHAAAAELYQNICFRPRTDKSPNGVLVDKTMAYPAGCYNLAKMKMTGKGGITCDRAEAYRLFDRACRGGHGGACYLQAQILCTRPGALEEEKQKKKKKTIPFDPQKAMQLYQQNCNNGDSISCFTLATMLLRGDRVNKTADNVSPQEATGQVPIVKRENESDRAASTADKYYVIPRDPARAEKLLQQACDTGAHVTSCHNLAVMYTVGDDGVPANPELAEKYKKLTQEKMSLFGGL